MAKFDSRQNCARLAHAPGEKCVIGFSSYKITSKTEPNQAQSRTRLQFHPVPPMGADLGFAADEPLECHDHPPIYLTRSPRAISGAIAFRCHQQEGWIPQPRQRPYVAL